MSSKHPPPASKAGAGADLPHPPVRRRGKRRRSSSGGKKHRTSLPGASAVIDEHHHHRPEDDDVVDDVNVEIDADLTFDNVVKVFATIQEPDFANPWQSLGVESATGSGVVIRTATTAAARDDDGSRMMILTAAHVVSDCTFLQVQRIGVENPNKHVARVHAVRHECDLALVVVEDEGEGEFWKDLTPAELGDVPSLRSVVLVAGFPVGGEELSITEGVVSRIEGQPYSHSQRYLLAVTVDAAINEGNSGGPVFHDGGELVGIAFQALEGAENTGHIIPPPIIRHFLEGVARRGPEGYEGFPADGIKWQNLTNKCLRRYCNLDDTVRGVLVTDVYYGNTCHGVLRKNDILTDVAGRAIANNGSVAYGKYGRVDLSVVFTLFQCEDDIDLGIVRDGTPTTVRVTAKPFVRLVPLAEHDRRPRYFIYCGLVFQPLSFDYLDSIDASIPALNELFYSGHQKEDMLEVVVLSQTLSDEVNIGYETLTNRPIKSVNGKGPVRDLKDLVARVEASTEPLLRFDSAGEEDVIVVPSPKNADTAEANDRILSRYKVTSDRCLESGSINC